MRHIPVNNASAIKRNRTSLPGLGAMSPIRLRIRFSEVSRAQKGRVVILGRILQDIIFWMVKGVGLVLTCVRTNPTVYS